MEKYNYSAFGQTTVTLNGNTGNPYRFTGREYEPETGLYYYRARFYSPQLGRFLQPDPIGYIDGMNLYAYCGNNPLAFVDPMGLCKGDRIAKLQNYINSAEAAMLANIETLNFLHKKIRSIHDYYWWLLVGNTTMSAVSVANTVHQFSLASSYASSAQLATRAPFPNAWDAQIKLNAMSQAALRSGQTGIAMDLGGTILSMANTINISQARRKTISKYDQMLEQTLINIETISHGVTTANAEIERLRNE